MAGMLWQKKNILISAEMWGLMKEWLEDQPAQIPDDDSLEIDLCGLRYTYDSKGRLKLESKDDAKIAGLSLRMMVMHWRLLLPIRFGLPVKQRYSKTGAVPSSSSRYGHVT